MKNYRAVVVLACVTVLTSPPGAAYGQCVVFDKPDELFALSDAVFVGTAVANERTETQGAHAIANIATVRLERSWKGRAERDVRVGSDAPFEVGKRYLVFADGKPLSTSILCHWAERVESARNKLDWLSKKRSRRAADQ